MVIGLDGRMSAEAGVLAGLTQAEADEIVIGWLREHGQLEKRESYRHPSATATRSATASTARVLQWWCEMPSSWRPQSKPSSGRVSFTPR